MKVKQFNKATAAALGGAAATIVGAFLTVDAEILAAFQTLLTTVLVWLIPNGA